MQARALKCRCLSPVPSAAELTHPPVVGHATLGPSFSGQPMPPRAQPGQLALPDVLFWRQVSPWQPAEPLSSPAPSFEWPEIRIHERVSETRSERQLSHLRSRDSGPPEVAVQCDPVSPQPSQSLLNEAQELESREASSSSKLSHDYRCCLRQAVEPGRGLVLGHARACQASSVL